MEQENISQEQLMLMIKNLVSNQQVLTESLAQINEKQNNSLTRKFKNLFKSSPNTKINNKNEPSLIEENESQLSLFEDNEFVLPVTPRAESTQKPSKVSSFKNLVATHFVDFTNQYGFKNDKIDWYNLGHKVGLSISIQKEEAKQHLGSIMKAFKAIAEAAGVAFNFTRSSAHNLKDSLTLIGDKKTINELNEKLSETLNMVGFEANDLYHETKKENFLEKDEVQAKVDEKLKVLKFLKENDKYTNEFLTKLDDEGKASIIYNALWPSLAKEIKAGMKLAGEIDKMSNENKFMVMLNQFAQQNKMKSEDIVTLLNKDPDAFSPGHILANTIGKEKIMNNYQDILDNVTKFSILSDNTRILTTGFVKVAEDMKEMIAGLNIDVEKKQKIIKLMDESKLHTILNGKQEYTYTYENIKNNMAKFRETHNVGPEKSVTPAVESQTTTAETVTNEIVPPVETNSGPTVPKF